LRRHATSDDTITTLNIPLWPTTSLVLLPFVHQDTRNSCAMIVRRLTAYVPTKQDIFGDDYFRQVRQSYSARMMPDIHDDMIIYLVLMYRDGLQVCFSSRHSYFSFHIVN